MIPEDRNRRITRKICVKLARALRHYPEIDNIWVNMGLEDKKTLRNVILDLLDTQVELIRLEERYCICLLIAAIRQSYTKQMLSTWDTDTHSERLKGYREIEVIVNEYREASQKRIKKEE